MHPNHPPQPPPLFIPNQQWPMFFNPMQNFNPQSGMVTNLPPLMLQQMHSQYNPPPPPPPPPPLPPPPPPPPQQPPLPQNMNVQAKNQQLGVEFNNNQGIMPLLSNNKQPKTTPLMSVQPPSNLSNINQAQSERDYKINRFDGNKPLEHFVEDYFNESLKHLRKKIKKPCDVDYFSNVKIEVQTTEFNHGLSSSSSKSTLIDLTDGKNKSAKSLVSTVAAGNNIPPVSASMINQSSGQSQAQSSGSQPPSLLSLKIPTVDLNTIKPTQSLSKSNSTSLFPIMADLKSETKNESQTKTNTSQANMSLSNFKTIPIEEVLLKPSRDKRPHKLVIILRGPPGSGKSFVANLIKQEEEKYVSDSEKPKILSIDNYFITEQENGPSNNKQILMKYEYDKAYDETYQKSLIKSFKKTVDDDLFNFIIVDMINESVAKIDEMSGYAKLRGFHVFVVELSQYDATTCFSRNVHNRKMADIEQIIKNWQQLPNTYTRLDVSFFIQNGEIENVEMEDDININNSNIASLASDVKKEAVDQTSNEKVAHKSKWDSNSNRENAKRQKAN